MKLNVFDPEYAELDEKLPEVEEVVAEDSDEVEADETE
jgi:hypothetical protein